MQQTLFKQSYTLCDMDYKTIEYEIIISRLIEISINKNIIPNDISDYRNVRNFTGYVSEIMQMMKNLQIIIGYDIEKIFQINVSPREEFLYSLRVEYDKWICYYNISINENLLAECYQKNIEKKDIHG